MTVDDSRRISLINREIYIYISLSIEEMMTLRLIGPSVITCHHRIGAGKWIKNGIKSDSFDMGGANSAHCVVPLAICVSAKRILEAASLSSGAKKTVT
jgi:hypothetical protein